MLFFAIVIDHFFKSVSVSLRGACVKRSIPCQLGRQTFKWLAALCAQMFAHDELRGSRGVSVRDVTNEVPAAVWISMALEKAPPHKKCVCRHRSD